MFSCCRCVNPKSPKYKKKGDKDNEDDDSSVAQEEQGVIKEESSEEEIKVEIIETDVRGENAVESSEAEDTTTKQSASPPTAPPDGGTTGSATSTSTASPAKVPTTDEANQSQSSQQPVVACCSPKDSPGKSAEPTSEAVTVDEVASVENVIPTTVAEVVEANDTAGEAAPAEVSTASDSAITANVEEREKNEVDEAESKPCELKNEENNVIMEHAENATNGPAPDPVQQDNEGGDKESGLEQEQKTRECEGNGKRIWYQLDGESSRAFAAAAAAIVVAMLLM